MSEINFKKKDDVYKKAKSRLAKYLTDLIGLSEATGGIKIKSGLITAEMEEVLVTKGWTRPPQKSGGRQNRSIRRRQSQGKKEKPMNPLNEKGQPLLCSSCGSYRHMLNSCPDSWENSSKKRTEKSYYTDNTESEGEEQAFFTRDFKVPYKKMCKYDKNVKNVVLYTRVNKKKKDFL